MLLTLTHSVLGFTKIASKVSPHLFDVTYENAVMTHGNKNIRSFVCTKDNVAELNAILKKYKNGILKKD